MSANILFLYIATVIIWGTTWLGIKFQLGSVDPMVSVLYRFIAASVILMVYCRLAGLKMRFYPRDHILWRCRGWCCFL
jgi:drug/metabolite transporter (DMT)-like permease